MSTSLDISILIPTSGRKAWLEVTLQSLVIVENIREIIIIEDSKKHHAYNVPESIKKITKVFRLHENLGESTAVNIGLSLISSPWFVILSDDDPQPQNWLPDMLHAILKDGQNHDIYVPSYIFSSKNRASYSVRWANKVSNYEIINYLMMPAGPGAIIRTSCATKLGLLRDPYALFPSDMIQWLNLSLANLKYKFLPNIFAYWNTHELQGLRMLDNEKKSYLLGNSLFRWQNKNRYFNQQQFLSIILRQAQFLAVDFSVLEKFSYYFRQIYFFSSKYNISSLNLFKVFSFFILHKTKLSAVNSYYRIRFYSSLNKSLQYIKSLENIFENLRFKTN